MLLKYSDLYSDLNFQSNSEKYVSGKTGLFKYFQLIFLELLFSSSPIYKPNVYIYFYFSKQVKSDQKQQPVEVIERKICLTTESILPSEKEQLTFLSVPPNKSDDSDAPGDSYTYVTEAGHGASVCPRGMYCLHLTKVFFLQF